MTWTLGQPPLTDAVPPVLSLCRHEWLDGYRWLSVDVANERLRNPDGRRQQVKAALMEQAQPASQRQPHPGE